jgi:TP901-1 family phage major tail protein
MSGKKGRDVLIKAEVTPGTWVTIGGLRSKSISLNDEMVDTSDNESAGRWRELGEGFGIRTFSISGGGLIKKSQGEQFLKNQFVAGTHPRLQFIVADFLTVEAKCQITKMDFSGDYNKEAAYSLSFENNGEVTLT